MYLELSDCDLHGVYGNLWQLNPELVTMLR